MKRLLFILAGAALALSYPAGAQQRRSCGTPEMHKAMIAQDPSWAEKLAAQRASLQQIADDYITQQKSGALEKTTATSAVPVIFHIIVDSEQFNEMGATAGIIKRVDSQIAILERDFNKKNPDSTSIPSSWKALYGNVGIHFGLARKDPNGHCTPGYEIKIISSSGYSDQIMAFASAKSASTGLASWDVTKYYNVWCINFSGSSLLGITVPRSQYSFYGGVNNVGVCILYSTLGKTATGAGTFPSQYNLGRTLTHETGHFFEIWHPWGDDGAGGVSAVDTGTCPWAASGCGPGTGLDDGLSDTPPESQAIYGTPTYTITGGTINDCCQMQSTTNKQPIGIACLSYMDYTDDDAMHLFTPMQAAVMASMALVAPGGSGTTAGAGAVGESYSLTQNPSLLACPTEVSGIEADGKLNIYPNPSTGQTNISIDETNDELNEIAVYNIVGQQVAGVKGSKKEYYSIDLSTMSKGIYIVKCNFASGSVTKKILLQ